MPREWIGWILVAIGLARAAFLVAGEPLMGYANQFDMVRTSACIGLYPDLPEPARYQASPAAPISTYRPGPAISGGCYPSSEALLAGTVMRVSSWIRGQTGTMPLRDVGYAKLALLAIAVLAIGWSLHAHPTAALLHGLVVLLVWGDPVATLWMNTLFTEFTALWGLYVVVGTACAAALMPRASSVNAMLLVSGLITLAFSREQFALLAPILALLAAPWLWARSRHLAVAAFGVALVAAIVSFALLPRPPEIARANRVDAYLGLLVPASTQPASALRRLGLPERCAVVVGVTAYLPRGENLEQECPEVFALSSVAFLAFARDDPRVLARAAARVMPALQPPSPAYLGVVAGREHATLQDLPPWHFSPLHEVLTRLPILVYAALLVGMIVAAPLAFVAALVLARPARGWPAVPLLLAMMLGTTVAYAFATTVYGDGLSEAARHFLPGTLAFVAGMIAFMVGVPAVLARWWRGPRHHAVEIGVGLVAAIVVLVAAAGAIRWARGQPLALGVLDEPTGREIRVAGTVLRGWVLDPFGVEEVELRLGAVRRPVPFGNVVKKGLEPLYPSYPDAARAGFVVELGAAELSGAFPEGEGELAIAVRSRTGAVTQVERRRLRLTP